MKNIKKSIIIIESLKGYEIAKKSKKIDLLKKNFIWGSLSGHVLKKLGDYGEECINLDSLAEKKDVEQLDFLSGQLSLKIIDLLNLNFLTENQLNISKSTRKTFSSVVFVTLYRSYLLNKLKSTNFYGEIFCVGKKNLLSDNDLYLNYSHFDTLFSLIFSQSDNHSQYIINDEITLEEINNKIKKKRKYKISLTEKIISLLEKSSSEIIFKIFKKTNIEKIYNKLIANKNKVPVIIYGENDIISNIFNSILINRNKIYIKDRLKFELSTIKYEIKNPINLNDKIIESINNNLKKEILQIKDLLSNYFDLSLKLILKKYFYTFDLIDKNESQLNSKFIEYSKNFSKSIIFTNGYYSIPEKMFYQFYKERFDNRTVSFSHGVTIGINLKSLDNLRESMINFTDELVFFDFVSYYFYRKLKIKKRMYVSGIPNKNIFFKKFFKNLIKKKFNLKNKKVVILVVESEKNNIYNSSKYENDKVFYENIKKRVKYLKEKYPDYSIFLKLYPNQCFFDEYDFDELKKDNENLIILKYFEFRWLTYIADIIYSSTYESTPQYILSSGCEYYQFSDINNKITKFITKEVSNDFYLFKKKWFIKEFDKDLFKKIYLN